MHYIIAAFDVMLEAINTCLIASAVANQYYDILFLFCVPSIQIRRFGCCNCLFALLDPKHWVGVYPDWAQPSGWFSRLAGNELL